MKSNTSYAKFRRCLFLSLLVAIATNNRGRVLENKGILINRYGEDERPRPRYFSLTLTFTKEGIIGIHSGKEATTKAIDS